MSVHPMEKLLDNYMKVEEEGAFLEEGGTISYTGVFLHDEDSDEDNDSDDSAEAEVMQHLHAALGAASALGHGFAGPGGVGTTGAGSSGSSSGITSTSGGSSTNASPDGGDEKEAWKVALMEGLEDFLQVEAGGTGSGTTGGRRFSIDLSGLDMHALEQLAAGTVSGPSSRRGSFSLTMLEAEGLMPKSLLPITPAAGPRAAAPVVVKVKQEVPDDESPASSTSAAPSLSTASNSTTTTTAKKGPKAAPTPQAPKKKATVPATPTLTPTSSASSSSAASTPGTSLSTPSPVSAASLLPRPSTPHKTAIAAAHAAAAATAAAAAAANNATPGGTNGSPGVLVLPVIPNDGVKRIGIYTLEERKVRVARFQAKRSRRVWRKKIKYDCRKKLADNRPRVKGRFVRRDEEIDIIVGGAVAAAAAEAEAGGMDGAAGSSNSCLLTQLMDLDDLLED